MGVKSHGKDMGGFGVRVLNVVAYRVRAKSFELPCWQDGQQLFLVEETLASTFRCPTIKVHRLLTHVVARFREPGCIDGDLKKQP